MRKNMIEIVDCMKAKCQKRFKQNTKRKNLGRTNFCNFNEAGQQRIQEQVLQAMGNCNISDTKSVASSVTTPSSAAPSASARRG